MNHKRIFTRLGLSAMVCCFLMAGPSCGRAWADDSDRRLFSRISSYYRAYDTIRKIKDDIRAAPDYYANYFALSYAYFELEMYERQVKTLNEALARVPEDEPQRDILYTNLGGAHILLGDWHKARPVLEKALEINPGSLEARELISRYYIHRGEYARAADELKTLSALESGRDFFYETFVYMFRGPEDYARTVELFREAVDLDPGNAKARRVLGIVLRSDPRMISDNFEDSMKELRKALELDPGYIPTYISLGDNYLLRMVKENNKDHFDEALEWFDQALKLDPDSAKIFTVRGHLFFYAEKYDKAREAFEKARMLGNTSENLSRMLASTYNNLAYETYLGAENMEEGLDLVEKALAMVPEEAVFLGTKAEILYKMGRLEEAYAVIRRAVGKEPANPELKRDLEMIQEALQKQKGAPPVLK